MLWLLLRNFPSCDSVWPSEGHPGWRVSSVLLLTINESKGPETSWVLRTFALGWARDTPVKKQCFSEVGLWETRCIMSMGTGHEVWTLGGLANSKGAALSSWKHKCYHISLYYHLYLYHLSMYHYRYIYRSAMWLTGGTQGKCSGQQLMYPVTTIVVVTWGCPHRLLHVHHPVSRAIWGSVRGVILQKKVCPRMGVWTLRSKPLSTCSFLSLCSVLPVQDERPPLLL